MTAEEVDLKFGSASATCKGNKCPFAAGCTGRYDTCKLKEVATILRFQITELEQLRSEAELLRGAVALIGNYCHELEKINKAYYRLLMKYYDGEHPKVRPKKRTPRVNRKKKSLIEMDGDERYAMPEEPKEPKQPVVII